MKVYNNTLIKIMFWPFCVDSDLCTMFYVVIVVFLTSSFYHCLIPALAISIVLFIINVIKFCKRLLSIIAVIIKYMNCLISYGRIIKILIVLCI